ncbi:TetR/AcrR family transcriptional regulator [Dactylosporangium vinaceum]|uniref:TetR/AcrR family transcriptional regulator n=1 Tax=Dactylosporangium vinaceum TaxID=53362 RepID=A0ABV5M4G4_9ACTN|nr:TetR/AcrR family transcriptional regulator [Dactylosporangium vinaceum]
MSRPMRADAQRNRARILAAADAVFAEGGATASTEEVARRAGVAIGTVFRHFPTKDDLVRALLKRLLEELTAAAADLDGRPGGLLALFELIVERTAANRTVVEVLAAEVPLAGPLGTLSAAADRLLQQGQAAGELRESVRIDAVMALLAGVTQAALSSPPDLRRRALDIVFTGLRRTPSAAPPPQTRTV